jgi:ribose transport system substrate-binding protein
MRWNKELLGIAIGAGLSVGLTGAGIAADETYIPLISKGFQHQFWQAVRAGAEQAGKDYKVKVTFEGPETEAMVDKQIDMRRSRLWLSTPA